MWTSNYIKQKTSTCLDLEMCKHADLAVHFAFTVTHQTIIIACECSIHTLPLIYRIRNTADLRIHDNNLARMFVYILHLHYECTIQG